MAKSPDTSPSDSESLGATIPGGTGRTCKLPWCRVEKIRSERDIPKKLLAERLGVNYSYLVDLLNGRYPSRIDDEKLTILADIFQMPRAALLQEISPQAVPPKTPLPVTESPKSPEILDHTSGEPLTSLLHPSTLPEISLRLMDDSMSPPFPKGTIFTITSMPPRQVAGEATTRDETPALGMLVLVTLRNACTWVRELYKIEIQPTVSAGDSFGADLSTTADVPKASPKGMTEWVILKPYNKDWEYLQIARKDIVLLQPVSSITLPS